MKFTIIDTDFKKLDDDVEFETIEEMEGYLYGKFYTELTSSDQVFQRDQIIIDFKKNEIMIYNSWIE